MTPRVELLVGQQLSNGLQQLPLSVGDTQPS